MGSRGGAGGSFDKGLIDPSNFPCKSDDLDTEDIYFACGELRTVGNELLRHMTAIGTVWQGLGEHYEAPSGTLMLTLMDPAKTDSEISADVYINIAAKLGQFAQELDRVKPRLADLEDRASTFRADVIDGVEVLAEDELGMFGWSTPTLASRALNKLGAIDTHKTIPWYEHGPSVAENTDLLEEYARLLEDVSTSATETANAIRQIDGVLDGSTYPAPFEPITSDEIMQATDLPWGAPTEEKRNCAEQVSDGIGNFGKDTLFGITSFVGYHPDTGWSMDTFTQTWGGAANLVGSLAVANVGTMLLATLAPDTAAGKWAKDRLEVVGRAGAGLVGYDLDAALAGEDGWHQWKDEPWKMGTGLVLDIGSCFVPGVGAVKVASKTGTLTKLAKVADVLLPGGGWMVKGGNKIWQRGGELISSQISDLAAKLARAGEDLAKVSSSAAQKVRSVSDYLSTTKLDTKKVARATEHPAASESIRSVDIKKEAARGQKEIEAYLHDDNGLSQEMARIAREQELAAAGAIKAATPDGMLRNADTVTNRAGSGTSTRVEPINVDHATPGRPGSGGTGSGIGDVGPIRGGSGSGSGSGGGLPDDLPKIVVPKEPRVWDSTQQLETITQAELKKAGRDLPAYSQADVDKALAEAPVNAKGEPVDHRTGAPLNPDTRDGRGWVMAILAGTEKNPVWVAQNPGKGWGLKGMPPTGIPNSYGYDELGNLMEYANNRPNYREGLVATVWRMASPAWRKDPISGVWVRNPNIKDAVRVETRGGKFEEVEWDPVLQPSREGLWDMGHVRGKKYSDLLDQYLSHGISKEEFLNAYNDPDFYQVEDPLRNRSHVDE